jgi:hypothetical protein
MKGLLRIVFAVGVGLVIGRCAQAAAPSCGDVNGDGSLNITDPIYLLQHLFQGGPAPAPIVCPATGVPATGQTKCYDDAEPANEIPCESTDFPGQDGFYQAGCPNEGRFVDNGDGTVTDNCTRLMWQKDAADVTGDGSIGQEDHVNWQAALKYCEALSFAAHDDWRLPNIRELLSIADYARDFPALDPGFGALSVEYWSSSSYSGGPFHAWGVSFRDGVGTRDYDKDIRHCVRAVRAPP